MNDIHILDIIGVFVVIFVAVLAYNVIMGDAKTRLFRRVWSSEKLRNSTPHMARSQSDAVSLLVQMYAIQRRDDKLAFTQSTTQLIADAIAFDLNNPRHGGVQVAPVLAREMAARYPYPDDDDAG